MRVFLDTNVLLDVIEKRAPFFSTSQEVLDRCGQLGFEIFVSWHAIATIFYITAKKRNEALANLMISRMLTWATVATVGHGDAMKALTYRINDYEDVLQVAAAEPCFADFMVTRDVLGFKLSPTACVNPEEFLQKFPSR